MVSVKEWVIEDIKYHKKVLLVNIKSIVSLQDGTTFTNEIRTKLDNINDMNKYKTLYDKLLPPLKDALRKSAREYDTAKRLKYNLMSKSHWWDLNIEEIKEIFTWCNIYSFEYDAYTFLYGEKIIKKDD